MALARSISHSFFFRLIFLKCLGMAARTQENQRIIKEEIVTLFHATISLRNSSAAELFSTTRAHIHWLRIAQKLAPICTTKGFPERLFRVGEFGPFMRNDKTQSLVRLN
jgi:hypothetical protein